MSVAEAVLKEKKYFVFRFVGTLNGDIAVEVQTHWVGWENGQPSENEIREASLMDPNWFTNAWKKLGERFLVVNTVEEVAVLLAQGGNALIEESVARAIFPERLAPKVYRASERGLAGIVAKKPERVRDRAPTKKVRMEALNRDDYRCRICGRRASNHVDLELNVHHIIPWEEGGLSERKNLITLCRTCHVGLDPHFEPKLFELLPDNERLSDRELRFDYRIEETLYRQAWAKRWSD
jgi:hypothetical protein